MSKTYIQVLLLTTIFIFFFGILNSDQINLISTEYYQWIISNIRTNHQSIVLFFLKFPLLYIYGGCIMIYLLIILRGNHIVQGVGMLYITIFLIFYITPDFRYTNIGKEYIVTEKIPSMIPYQGTLYENNTRIINSGEKVHIIDFRVIDSMDPNRTYIPFLCTDDARCFVPVSGAQHAYFETPIDARRIFFQFFL